MKYNKHATKEETINSYKKLCYDLGKVANKDDIRNCNYICSADRIRILFGSWTDFVKQSGVCKNGETVGMPLKETVEKILVEKRVEFGRRLDHLECNSNNSLPNIAYVRRLYGNKTLNKIWDELEERYNISDINKYDLLYVERGITMKFGHILRILREEKDISQVELAKKLNITSQALSQYELNKRIPDIDMIVRFADIFNVSVDYLIGRTNIKEPIDNKHKSNKSNMEDVLLEGIKDLSLESQNELKKLIELYKIKDMQNRNTKLT